MESMKNTVQSAPPDKVFLAYVNRRPLHKMDMRWGKQVLAGASFSENEVLDWIEKGKLCFRSVAWLPSMQET